ncbi:MAG: hypothetical protein WC238_00020 [Parcubacteria group bacterium]|jgi:2'-5' RNA ligase
MENNIELRATGYLVNAEISGKNRAVLKLIQDDILDEFPGAVWKTPTDNLHITLTTIVDPFFDYGEDRDELFEKNYPAYEKFLEDIFSQQQAFDVVFDEIRVTSDAVIIIGKDDGNFQKIREAFSEKISRLPKMAKMPRTPNIIHSTIIRIINPDNLGRFRDYVSQKNPHLTVRVESFRLVKETKVPAVDVQILKTYKLGQ